MGVYTEFSQTKLQTKKTQTPKIAKFHIRSEESTHNFKGSSSEFIALTVTFYSGKGQGFCTFHHHVPCF